MADVETEKEWQKSRQIEAERMKAARALAEEKADKSNLAFFDPKATKIKGWTNDSDVVMASAERMGNRAVVLAICGVVLDIIGVAGGMVSSAFNLGMAGVVVSGIPSGIGVFLIGLSVLMAVVTIGCEIGFKVKQGKKFTSALWSALAAIGVVIVYFAARWLIIRFG